MPEDYEGTDRTKNDMPAASGEQVLAELMHGNRLYRAGETQFPNLDGSRRLETALLGQKPKATVIGCSDSRVPIEVLFNQGIGDLFVVRIIGNVATDEAIASIEFGIVYLETPLLIVLGHSQCGAITATIEGIKTPGKISTLLGSISPVVDQIKADLPDAPLSEKVATAVKANVYFQMEAILRGSMHVSKAVEAGQVTLAGAIYHLESGTIELLGPHPNQGQILSEPARN